MDVCVFARLNSCACQAFTNTTNQTHTHIRLLRLYRIQRLIDAMRLHYPKSVYMINSVNLILCLFLVAHWMCCVWFNFGYNPDGWVASQGLVDVVDGPDGPTVEPIPDNVTFEWLTSFYWAITTMTTIGYGDISAATEQERGIACVVMIFGCGFFAWSTGLITSLMTDMPHCEARFKESLDDLQEFMEANDLPLGLRKKLRDYYALKFPTMKMYDDQAVLDGLPIGLQKEVRIEMYADTMKKSWFFHGIQEDAFGEIANHLRSVFKTETVSVTTAGEVPDAMYFVRSGVLEVHFEGRRVGEVRSKDVFGESALLGLSKDGRRLRTVTCRTMCELIELSKEHLYELLRHEEIRLPIQRMMQMYLSKMEHLAQEDNLTPHNLVMVPWGQLSQDLRTRAKTNVRSVGDSGAKRTIQKSRSSWLASSCKDNASGIIKSVSETDNAKIFNTLLRIQIREFEMSDDTLNGVYRIVMAASWPGHLHKNVQDTSQVYPVRSWGRLFKVNFEAGFADVSEVSNFGCTVAMLLQHEYMPWSRMPGIKVLMYEVLGDHSESTFSHPEGYFPRLDRDDASVAEMISIEERNGLRLLGIGSVSVGQLIHSRNRSDVMARDQRKMFLKTTAVGNSTGPPFITTTHEKMSALGMGELGHMVKSMEWNKDIPVVTIRFSPGVCCEELSTGHVQPLSESPQICFDLVHMPPSTCKIDDALTQNSSLSSMCCPRKISIRY